MQPYILLALIAAVGYSIGSLFSKQSMAEGCGRHRVTAFNIWATTLLLFPFLFLSREPAPRDLWYQPLITSVCFLSGNILFILALRTGDLSIVGPLSGMKPVLNAILVATLLGVQVPATTWTASGLTVIALLVMRTPNASTSHSFLRTALITLGSMFSFSLCDTCFQQWAAGWNIFRFATITFGLASMAMCTLIPRFDTPWKQLTRKAKTHVLTGAACHAIPGLCIGFALGRYGHAPEINIAYSTRAVGSILVVWVLGRFIGSREHHASRTVLLRRLTGTAILMVALALVIFGNAS